MNTNLITLAVIASMAAAPAFAADKTSAESKTSTKIEQDSEGNYTKKHTSSSVSTDAEGTTSKEKIKAKVEVDADGTAEKTTTAESSTDPKGLMNKTKTVVTDTTKEKDGKIEVSHKKKVDGKTVESTKEVNEVAPAAR